MNEVKRKHIESKQIDLEKVRRAELQYMKLCYKADVAAVKHANKDIADWTSKSDIKTFLTPLKRSTDSKMSEGKDELVSRYHAWKHRIRNDLSTDSEVLDDFQKWVQEKREGVNNPS